MDEWVQRQLQALPQVDLLLRQPEITRWNRTACKAAVRFVLQQ